MKITDNLYEKLSTYGKSDYYPFHMPGHKRNDTFLKLENFVKSDITEIDGFDNLHKAKSIIPVLRRKKELPPSMVQKKHIFLSMEALSDCWRQFAEAAATAIKFLSQEIVISRFIMQLSFLD